MHVLISYLSVLAFSTAMARVYLTATSEEH